MGDLTTAAVAGTLYWIPLREFERVRSEVTHPVERAALFADACRLNALYMIARAGSGHIGSTFSSLDIVTWLQLQELTGLDASRSAAQDLYFCSKGHDVPGLYAVLLGLGRLPWEKLHALRRLDGLPGHPDVGTPGIVTNTGSLGMGISKAKGMIFANRKLGRAGRVFVLTGDGELQEGQIWESLISAAAHGLHELTVIVDHNKLQSDTFLERTSPLGDLPAKFTSFGWHVERVAGHDFAALGRTLERVRQNPLPKLILADTVKGRGVSFMEHTALDSDTALYRFHSGAPDASAYTKAADELIQKLRTRCTALGLAPLELSTTEQPVSTPALHLERLIPAYAAALVSELERVPELVVLDADLAVDTGQLPAREAFPERCLECGIAEMDMVSQAGGMALRGLLPICHSFACFLSTRANEQIYNNATEHTRVIYVASLAGLLPGGPGHSHQSVRDISALAAVPGLTLLSPACEAEVRLALRFCIQGAPGSSWLRLESVPCAVPYELPAGYQLELGRGAVLRPGSDGVFIGYGPVLLSEAYRAAQLLEREAALSLGVINLPWLNTLDAAWLKRALAGVRHVFALDNHYLIGGQGERIAAALVESGLAGSVHLTRFAVESIPACGSNAEVLAAHGLDAQSLAARARAILMGKLA